MNTGTGDRGDETEQVPLLRPVNMSPSGSSVPLVPIPNATPQMHVTPLLRRVQDKLDLSMSTSSSQDDWRAQALQNMEQADQPATPHERQDNWAATVMLKFGLLILLTIPLVWFGGFGFLFAVALVAWYLFWPR